MEAFRYFFPGDCYEEILVKFNVFDGPCLKLLISRFFSLNIILGSILVKVPQIVKCLQAGSVENLSYVASFLELAAVTFTCAYNYAKGFPFSSWGESFFISVQMLILISLLFYYNQHAVYMLAFFPVYAAVLWYLTSDLVTMEILATFQASVIPMMLLSRFSQIITTFQNKATGQLSLITSTLNWLGTGARIFTTIQETQDLLILANYGASFTANTIILVQFLIYPATPTTEKKER